MASETWVSRLSHFMVIPNTKRHPNNTKTDQLPFWGVITDIPSPYLSTLGSSQSVRLDVTWLRTLPHLQRSLGFFADEPTAHAAGNTAVG